MIGTAYVLATIAWAQQYTTANPHISKNMLTDSGIDATIIITVGEH